MSLPTNIGRYEVVELVGRGGMGAVYRGRDAVLDRDVAIKMMSAEYVEDEERRARFYREARAAARLQHRNIITVFEFGEHEGHPYMVMEFLRGMDLQHRLRTPPPISLDQKLDFAIGLLSGLGLAHQNGVIHRDVKPANVWVLDDGTVKLLDFGIAKLGASSSTRQGGVMGTVAYMSPEQVSGRPLDGRSDVFSAGVVLYEMLSGRKPFAGETVTEVMVGIIERTPAPIPELPSAIRAVLDRALEKNPDTRYQTAFEFAADLQLLRTRLHVDGDTLPQDLPLRTPSGPTKTQDDGAKRQHDSVNMPLHQQPPDGGREVGPPSPDTARRLRLGLGLAVAIIVVGVGAALWFYPRSLPRNDPKPPVENLQVKPPQPTLHITTTPPGATVTVDGAALSGVTPLTAQVRSAPGSRLSLSLPGHETKDLEPTSEQLASGFLDWHFVVTAVPATLQVSADYDFELQRQGRVVSSSAVRHTLRVQSSETIRAKAASVFLDQAITIPAKPPGTMRISLPALGVLSVRTNLETCEIMIDGRSAGFPPLTGQEVVSGSHILGLKCPDGQGPRQVLTIPAGGSVVALCQATGCQVQVR